MKKTEIRRMALFIFLGSYTQVHTALSPIGGAHLQGVIADGQDRDETLNALPKSSQLHHSPLLPYTNCLHSPCKPSSVTP